jgi:hypothetical protein
LTYTFWVSLRGAGDFVARGEAISLTRETTTKRTEKFLKTHIELCAKTRNYRLNKKEADRIKNTG